METISPIELNKKLRRANTVKMLIDVRTPAEYRSAHIAGAKNIPLNEIKNAISKLQSIGTVYVTCGSGTRSQRACVELAHKGIDAVNVQGGLRAWIREGLPIENGGRSVIPIIRQVMIVAGSLIILGVLLGWLVHQYWFLLSAFMGAGLLFAGLTGICTLSWILGKMPWNK